MKRESQNPGRFIYVTEVDVSIDNGPGINEREFVSGLLRRHGQQVECVLPEPSRPHVFIDSRVHYAPSHGGRLSGYATHLIGAYRIIRRLHREQAVDALVFRPGGTPILPWAVSVSTRVPVVLKKLGLYAIFGDEPTRSRVKNTVSRFLLPMYRSVIRGALAADVESYAYIDWLHERFGIERERMRVIPNGVNTTVFSPRQRDETRKRLDLARFDSIVGYVGALARIRRVGTLIDAFAQLETTDRTGLVLVGGGADVESLRAEVSRRGLGARVHFAGSVDYSEVPLWISAFDVAVDPTAVRMRLSEGIETASYSQKIGQYLACGVPVVAWRCRDTEFLEAESAGRTAEYPGVSALASAMQALLDVTEDERVERSQRARASAVRRFDSQMLADLRVEWWNCLVDMASRVDP